MKTNCLMFKEEEGGTGVIYLILTEHRTKWHFGQSAIVGNAQLSELFGNYTGGKDQDIEVWSLCLNLLSPSVCEVAVIDVCVLSSCHESTWQGETGNQKTGNIA